MMPEEAGARSLESRIGQEPLDLVAYQQGSPQYNMLIYLHLWYVPVPRIHVMNYEYHQPFALLHIVAQILKS